MNTGVDILLPTRDPRPDLLRRAVRSVLDQTWDNWSLYVVQDGGYGNVADSLAAFGDDRIHSFSVPARGKAVALNHAIARGSAPYIAYLDDDDVWYSNHLAIAIEAMQHRNIRFLHTDAHEVLVQSVEGQYQELSRRIMNRGLASDLLLWYVSHINTVHERSLFEEAGLYDVQREVFVDWDMLLRMARFAPPHHVRVVTCEHYVYLDDDRRQRNTISRVHADDPGRSHAMHREMIARALTRLSARDLVRAALDAQTRSLIVRYWLRPVR